MIRTFSFLLVALTGTAIALPAPAAAPGFPLLAKMEKGAWQLTPPVGAKRRICLRSGQEFFVLRHDAGQCTRFVVKNAPNELTVHLTCGPTGHVRTTLRLETPRLVQIDTQGVIDGSPFSDSFEARRVGTCG